MPSDDRSALSPNAPGVDSPAAKLTITTASSVHYVHHHLGIPILRNVTLHAAGQQPLGPGRIEFTFSPPFAQASPILFERVASGATLNLSIPDLRLDGPYLATCREQQNGNLCLRLFLDAPPTATTPSDGVEAPPAPDTVRPPVAEISQPLSLLAFNEWPGLGDLPELLASYVTPNQTCIEELLLAASHHLGETTGSNAIDGYQSGDPRRVLRIVESVYRAVQSRQLTYVNPPPSFEATGQKIRFAEQAWQSRQAACLDLALLFASALEAAGLHPLVCIEKGHAYVGCWLQPDLLFDLAFQDDVQALRKAATLQTLCVFETTVVTQPGVAFTTAELLGREHLQKDHDFRWALDIARARSKRVRPLPLALDDGRLYVAPEPDSPTAGDRPLVDSEIDARFADAAREATARTREQEPPDARIARWQRQLLDLSLRNRLLNLQPRACVRLLPGNLASLEDHLADAGEVRLIEKADADARSDALHALRTGEFLTETQLASDLADKKLRTDETRESLLQKLTKLEREAKVSLDESGSSSLFLALGILEWREHSGPSAKVRLAPLLLMPVHLTRQSVRSGFRLRRRDEDTQVNVTLLEKLKRDFAIEIPGIDPPPLDDSGVDVPLILRRIRKAILDAPGFEVREDAYLGPFSFAKFLLWQDLGRHLDQLKRNPVVAHLVDHWGAPFASENDFLSPDELDEKLPAHESFNVLEADSTQLAAVANAGLGRHFVLNGPPGTGKSQTIANMIAQCMALGKSVLFVAEKKTALEVVQRRLDKIGLAPFCLELHSNKSGKTEFVRQLREAVEFGGPATPDEWEHTARDLQKSRDQLNAFVDTLHRRCSNGLSPYACLGALIPAGGRAVLPLELAIDDPSAHTIGKREALRELVQQLALRLGHFPHALGHPLAPLGLADFSLRWETEVAEKLVALQSSLTVVITARDEAVATLKLDIAPRTAAQLAVFSTLCALLRELPDIAPSALRLTDLCKLRTDATDAIAKTQACVDACAALPEHDHPCLLALDLLGIERQWDALETKFAPLRWLGRRKLIALLATSRDPAAGKLTTEDVKPLLARARHLAATRDTWHAATTAMTVHFGALWHDGDPVPAEIEAALNWLGHLQTAIASLIGNDFMSLAATRDRLALLVEQGREWLREDQPGHSRLLAFEKAWGGLLDRRHAVEHSRELDLSWDKHPDLLADLAPLLSGLLAHRADWQRWVLLQDSRRHATDAGLAPLVDALLAGSVSRTQAAATFDQAYAWATLRRLLDREKILLNFFGEEHERAIARFRELDTRLTELNRRLVVARVASRRPQGLHDTRALGEIATLRAEIVKQRRLKPVRTLLGEIPDTLRRLKPCVLMSPLSVAQYLDPAQPPFDVVIFDEASQIPVCDAIGALARGRQSVVAGDPRQLPPTAFFQKVDLDPDDEEGDQPGQALPPDQESILDECLAARVPEHHLAWHYRSQRESLITFSNRHYYDNRLLTFPSPEAEERGVFFHPVADGFYDRGQTRTNRAEALAIVASVKAHLLDPRREKVSLAVITFNTEQMTLIENLIDAEREKDALFDEAMRARTASDLEEPFKVRNLESIQGDERDIIYFSITYGPDPAGYVSHNFGPLNKPGGERRLNVAVTRAKHEVHLFTTLRAGHIDLRRTGARGVLDLKDYLDYAENGVSALARPSAIPTGEDYDSEFERFVSDSLRHSGWIVNTQVGCSAYRIDLAVVHPDEPGRYLAGVECDGASYHRSATARDRDRLRQAFLGQLGWSLLRVWSTDWFRDAPRELDRLNQELKVLLEQARSTATTSPNPPIPQPREAASATPTGQTSEASIASAPSSVSSPDYPSYRPAELPSMEAQRDYFYEPRFRPAIARQIAEIIQSEAPVAEDLVIERVRNSWGFKRAGGRITDTIQTCLPADCRKTRSAGRIYLWHKDQSPDHFTVFRGDSADSPSRRKLDDIAPEELAAAMAWLVRRFVAADEDELLRETASVFGWKSLTATARETLHPALDLLLGRGFSRDSDGLIREPR